MAQHAKQHPFAGRHVVTNSDLAIGATVYVIDWIDRAHALIAMTVRWSGDTTDAVLVRDRLGPVLVHADELPAYDPQPIGFVS